MRIFVIIFVAVASLPSCASPTWKLSVDTNEILFRTTEPYPGCLERLAEIETIYQAVKNLFDVKQPPHRPILIEHHHEENVPQVWLEGPEGKRKLLRYRRTGNKDNFPAWELTPPLSKHELSTLRVELPKPNDFVKRDFTGQIDHVHFDAAFSPWTLLHEFTHVTLLQEYPESVGLHWVQEGLATWLQFARLEKGSESPSPPSLVDLYRWYKCPSLEMNSVRIFALSRGEFYGSRANWNYMVASLIVCFFLKEKRTHSPIRCGSCSTPLPMITFVF